MYPSKLVKATTRTRTTTIPRLDLYPVCLPPGPLLGGPREYPHGDRVPQRVGHHVALGVEHDLVVELLGHSLNQPGVLGVRDD